MLQSESRGAPIYLYNEFARTGELPYSRLGDQQAAVTRGDPGERTFARTFRAAVRFDSDADPSTPAGARASPQAILSEDGSYDGSGRADTRFGTDASGRLYISNKRNGLVYRARVRGTP